MEVLRQGTLAKFNHKKNMWISPRHPLYQKGAEFKIYYCAGILLHTRLNKGAGSFSNLQLERLMKSGFCLNSKETIEVMKLSQEVKTTVDHLLELLLNPMEQYIFIMDLANVSINEMSITIEEQKSIDLFAKLLDIDNKTKNLLIQYVTSAFYESYYDCKQLYEEMQRLGLGLKIGQLQYFTPNYEYIEVIEEEKIQNGKTIWQGGYRLSHSLVIPYGAELQLTDAVLYLNGNIEIKGGILKIENSKVICGNTGSITGEFYIKAGHGASVVIEDTVIDVKDAGGFLEMDKSNLAIKKSKISHTKKVSSIQLSDSALNIEETVFNDCISSENGGAIQIKNGTGQLKNCRFANCEAQNGGAIYSSNTVFISDCEFERCYARFHGGGIYAVGEIRSNVERCHFQDCLPKHENILQHLEGEETITIKKEHKIKYSTILECPIVVEEFGVLEIVNSLVYVGVGIQCSGILNMKNVKMCEYNLKERDLVSFHTTKTCYIVNCEFDGHLKCGIFRAAGARLDISHSIFRNVSNGRAIYDAFMPIVKDCVFTMCQNGALYCNSGKVINTHFVNCRARSGAGILMYGNRGEVENSMFVRCVSDYSGGGIDMSGSYHVINCHYEECKPNNISK